MAAYPIEITNFGNPAFNLHHEVVEELNTLQSDFVFCLPRKSQRNWAIPFEQESYSTQYVWEKLENYRTHYKGFHPFIIAIVHGALSSDKLNNLFGSLSTEKRLAVVTTKDWEARFGPPPLRAFLAYYFVRYTLSFVCPAIRAHQETHSCFFDKKMYKPDIKLSMESGRICDDCREQFNDSIEPDSYESLQKLVSYIKQKSLARDERRRKPSVFIGSSTEGLKVAELIQLNLNRVAECTIWSQGILRSIEGES